jgi:hypothetical protein
VFAFAGAFQFSAVPVKIERMIRDGKLKYFTGHFLDLLDTRIAKFKYALAIRADEMIVLFVFEGFLELGQVFTKLVFRNEVAIQKQFDGVVQGGTAHPVFFVLHVNIQALNIEVAGAAVNFIENGKTLGSFPVFFLFQIIGEQAFYPVLDFGLGHINLLEKQV